MRFAITVHSPQEVEATLTIRAPLKDLLALQKLQPQEWPATELVRAINDLAYKLRRNLEPSDEP